MGLIRSHPDRIAALALGEVEAAALRAWENDEKRFAAGDLKGARAAYDAFVKGHEQTKTAEAKMDALMERYVAIDRKLSPAPTISVDLAPDVTMEFVYIPPGTFVMGGNDDPKGDWQGVEKPKHTVRITKGFYLGTYEVAVGRVSPVTTNAALRRAPFPLRKRLVRTQVSAPP